MSIKSKVLAAAATLTLVGGIGTAGALTAGTASAATPSCGFTCINLFSYDFGTHHSPNFVVDVLRQGEKEQADTMLVKAQAVAELTTAHFSPESAVEAIQSGDLTLLEYKEPPPPPTPQPLALNGSADPETNGNGAVPALTNGQKMIGAPK